MDLHIKDYAVCSYWVIQYYPGAVFHPRVYLILMYLWTLLFAHSIQYFQELLYNSTEME